MSQFASTPILSLVIPCYNEEGNLRELHKAIHASVDPLGVEYEIVITDDCSKDSSWTILKELAATDPRMRVQKLNRNSIFLACSTSDISPTAATCCTA